MTKLSPRAEFLADATGAGEPNNLILPQTRCARRDAG
jgi:hypothetical protein